VRRWGIAVLLSVAHGCVDQELVIGNDRAQRACNEAADIVAPESGCTTLTVESNSPYGCVENDGVEHAGTWARLTRQEGLTVSVQISLRSSTALCAPGDAGVSACPASATIHASAGAPCTCELGSIETYPIPSSGLQLRMDATDEEVLLEPLGGVFDVALCTSP